MEITEIWSALLMLNNRLNLPDGYPMLAADVRATVASAVASSSEKWF